LIGVGVTVVIGTVTVIVVPDVPVATAPGGVIVLGPPFAIGIHDGSGGSQLGHGGKTFLISSAKVAIYPP
jgi:hypothetical protein